MDANDLNPLFKQPELYLNRELSLLEFNRRVLEQAKDSSTPLLERLRFLCISSTNLDEFFEIRVAGLKHRAELGSVQAGADNMSAQESLKAINHKVQLLVDEQYRVLNDVLIPALADQNIRFLRRNEWRAEQEGWLHRYFNEELLPVLSPLGLDPAHPFPRLLNKSLNFIVSLRGKDAFGRSGGVAVVRAPRLLPRLIQLPPETNGPFDFVFLSSVIHAYVEALFPGMKVNGCWQFRITRNSELFVDEEEVDDLLRAVEGELASRRYGAVVRLELAKDCPDEMRDYLKKTIHLNDEDLYRANGPVNLNRLSALADLVDRPDLKYPSFTPSLPAVLQTATNLFEVIASEDVLLHHPFQSFLPVIDFLRQAASDSSVIAIKQTLYRTGPDSAVVDALVDAAMNGKEVTVIIELRARFDEAANIELATRLQDAGAHVVYGIVGYKTHAKMVLVVRREGKQLRRYVHLGTGNYHPRTARLYTDYGLFTADKAVGEDVHQIFLQLTSLGRVPKLHKLWHSPFTLQENLIKHIEREAVSALNGKPARIIAKMNSLVEPQIIQNLYRASLAGVPIDLIVRGTCSLRPGVTGISERIHVRSIIGRFLEHTRVFYFENEGDHEVFCSSADWMGRNFYRRVEVCFPLLLKKHRDRIIEELGYYLRDNTQAWELQSDGSYLRVAPKEGETPFSAQAALLSRWSSEI